MMQTKREGNVSPKKHFSYYIKYLLLHIEKNILQEASALHAPDNLLKNRTGADAIKKFTPSLGIPDLGV